MSSLNTCAFFSRHIPLFRFRCLTDEELGQSCQESGIDGKEGHQVEVQII